MPTRTVWVREDDLEAFELIKDRPEWLHRAIEHEQELMKATELPAPQQRIEANPKNHTYLDEPTIEEIDDERYLPDL